MRLLATPRFTKSVKRLRPNQKADLDAALEAVAASPEAGERKQGDLGWLRVHKFRMVGQLTLLAYEIADEDTLVLHGVAGHENFYRDLKKR